MSSLFPEEEGTHLQTLFLFNPSGEESLDPSNLLTRRLSLSIVFFSVGTYELKSRESRVSCDLTDILDELLEIQVYLLYER